MQTVTVGITCKNSKDTIKQCVQSLLKLNYPKNKYKIFVVDGFSNDGTYEILKNYREKIILEQVKSNIAGGHNFIIKNSNAEITALTDADCVVDKNWLKELIKPFENKEIGAVTGLIKTPKNVSKLQKIIGRELESRYEKFHGFVFRGPTMNLAFKTRLAKKILFDEKYDVAQETEWGYRFTKNQKMIYAPKAVVYHYHRASWKKFFKQQFKYAEFAPKVYFKENLTKIKGDEISKASMMLQILFLYQINTNL
jgi:glycosyltransferase involved in cell wall biosynthesis